MAIRDLNDERFARITNTDPKESHAIEFRTIGISDDSNEIIYFHPALVSTALDDSLLTTKLLYLANQNSLFPVFLEPRHKEVLRYRYNQYKNGLRSLEGILDEKISPIDFKMNFGEISFSLAKALIPSHAIASKTLKDILKYREAMARSREQFLTDQLRELTSIIMDNPWDITTKGELQKYIMGKLNHSLIQYEIESQRIWEKMFGTLIVHLSNVTKAAVVGGSASSLIGSVIPNTNAWDMLLLGTLTGAVAEVPNLVKDLVDSILERKNLRKSSIAYLAEFR